MPCYYQLCGMYIGLSVKDVSHPLPLVSLTVVVVTWTNKISFSPCLQKHDVSYTYLIEDGAEFHANKEMCRESCPKFR